MILEFPRAPVRHVSEADAAPQAPRVAPSAAVLIILTLSALLWAAMIWGAITLCEAIVNG